MSDREYPKEHSKVTVTFTDGEVKEYIINASPHIGTYLARQMGSTGVLTLRNERQSWNLVSTAIRDFSLERYTPPEEANVRVSAKTKRQLVDQIVDLEDDLERAARAVYDAGGKLWVKSVHPELFDKFEQEQEKKGW